MTHPGIESQSPEPVVNILTVIPIAGQYMIYLKFMIYIYI